MFKFFTKITADDYGMLMNDTPASRRKVILLANSLFVPVLIWFFSALVMATNLFGASLLNGIFCGLIAGIFIFLIDRSILIANGNGWITSFRIIMGFCIATLGSIMVDECLFHEDINQRFEANKAMSIKSAKDEIAFLYASVIKDADSTVKQNYMIWQASVNEVKDEADGEGGSRQRGAGKITNLKAEISRTQQLQYEKALACKDSLLQVKNIATNQAEFRISASFGKSMLLHRIEALFDLAFSNKIMGFIYLIFTIFIWCMEFIVILFKMNSRETNYERKIKMIEQMGAARIERIALKDAQWFDSGKSHSAGKSLRQELSKTIPSIYN